MFSKYEQLFPLHSFLSPELPAYYNFIRSRRHPDVSNIRVHRKLAAEEGNIVVSPVSIAVALAMAAAGEHVLFLKKQSQNLC